MTLGCSSQLHQVLCGQPAGTDGGPDVLSAVQAGSGAGYGSRHPGGEREECEADQRPHLPGPMCTGCLVGWR